MNRIHEVFHTFGFDDYEKQLAPFGKGIMRYPPQNPNGKDANTLVNNNFMKNRRVLK